MSKQMDFIFNDGGRKDAGYKGVAGDCAVRAVAIATNQPYQETYDAINVFCKAEKRKKRRSSSRTGVHRDTLSKYLETIGWHWVPTMHVGSGCTVHMRSEELPPGRIITRLSRHFAAVIEGVCNDTYDSTREGGRCVYGYWSE